MISLIVYRNPLDEWLWESGAMFCFFAGLLIVIVSSFIYCVVADAIKRRKNRRK